MRFFEKLLDVFEALIIGFFKVIMVLIIASVFLIILGGTLWVKHYNLQ